MSDFFKSGKFKIILCMIALLVGIMLHSVTREGNALTGSSIVSDIFNPVKQAINSIGDTIGFNLNGIVNANEFKAENEKLKEQIADLQNQLVDYENAKSELEELRKFVDIKKEHSDYKISSPRTVVGRVTNDPYGSFIINRDKNDDIELYDPVVTSEGLVGIITEVAENYLTVKTLLSPDVSVGSIAVKSKDTGIIEGNIQYSKDGLCKMVYITKSHNLVEGDLVVTSGNSGKFPQEYIIGTIIKTGIEENGLSSYAIIEPAVDSRKVTSVVVMTDFNGQGDNYED